jgi:hypothetical protein
LKITPTAESAGIGIAWLGAAGAPPGGSRSVIVPTSTVAEPTLTLPTRTRGSPRWQRSIPGAADASIQAVRFKVAGVMNRPWRWRVKGPGPETLVPAAASPPLLGQLAVTKTLPVFEPA